MRRFFEAVACQSLIAVFALYFFMRHEKCTFTDGGAAIAIVGFCLAVLIGWMIIGSIEYGQ